MNLEKRKGQGALEYLLLLVAALFVVAIVFRFIDSTIAPTTDTGSASTFEFLCGPAPTGLNSNTADCACYRGNNDMGYNFGDEDLEDYCCNSTNSFLREQFQSKGGTCN